MKISIQDSVITSKDLLFANPPKKFRSQEQDTIFLYVPLQQKDYEWGNTDADNTAIEDLLSDLDVFLQTEKEQQDEKYFSGTLLLEASNDIPDTMKLIDGQQRVTTLYLLHYIAYSLAKSRLINMPLQTPSKNLMVQQTNRFRELIERESEVFHIKNNAEDIFYIKIEESEKILEDEAGVKLFKRIGQNKGSNNNSEIYWNSFDTRLKFKDDNVKDRFETAIRYTQFDAQPDGNAVKITVKNNKVKNENYYFNGIKKIVAYLNDTRDDNASTEKDELFKNAISRIDDWLKSCGLVAVISGDENDSFRLFEILNARGQELTALDLVKNLVLERFKEEGNLNEKQFEDGWQKLKNHVEKSTSKGKGDSIFVETILRTEGSVLRNREITYLRNKMQKNERKSIFREETIGHFYSRIRFLAEMMFDLANKKSQIYSTNYKGTIYQHASFMKLINYHWGYQTVYAMNILILLSSKYSNSLHNNWKEAQPSNALYNTLFVISDIVLKVGLVGVVLGKSSKDLPETTKEIVETIILYAEKNRPQIEENVNKLKDDVIRIATDKIFTRSNKSSFTNALENSYYLNTGVKKNIGKILFYALLNKGQIGYTINDIELEHLEPQNPVPGANNDYYTDVADRDHMISRIGNVIIIDSDDNKVFSNKPLKEKINLMNTDPVISKKQIYQHPLIKHINPDKNPIKDTIFQNLFIVKKATNETVPEDSFDKNGVPTKHFFNERSKMLAEFMSEIVFDFRKDIYGNEYK